MAEALRLGQSTEILPAGTALQKAQELYERLDIEERRFGPIKGEKKVNFSDGSWIMMERDIDYGSRDFVAITIADNKENRVVTCRISSNGRSSFQIRFAPIRIRVGGFTTTSDPHEIYKTPGARYEEQVMLDFVNWAGTSRDKGRITEPPYELGGVSMQKEVHHEPLSFLD